MNAIQGAHEKGRGGMERCVRDFKCCISDILSEGSEHKPAFPNILSKLGENTSRKFWRDFTLCLLGVQGENHLILKNDTAGKRAVFVGR